MGIGEIEVVRELGMLAGHRGDSLHAGQDTSLLTIAAYLQVLLFHVSALGLQHETGNLEVREAGTLHFQQQLVGQLLQCIVFQQLMLQVNDMLQSLQEPYINLRQFLDALDAVALFQSLCNGEDTQVGGVLQFLVEVVELRMVVPHEAVHALSDHTQSLLDHLLEGAADGHDLTHRLHRRADETTHAGELRQVPARNLTNHIVELRGYVC